MVKIVTLRTDDGPVKFEVDELPSDRTERVSRAGKNMVAELDQRLGDALNSVRPAAHTIIHTFQGLTPRTIDIEFGLKLDAEAGALIAKTGMSGHFTVKLTWQPTPETVSSSSTSPQPSN
ncbi:MAG: hypothetical protein M3276_08795 [Actinomycetota bacterium]|nr:hypothetical protein [Actinomycetota bacterium]